MGNDFYAYVQKSYNGNKSDVVQGRNTLIGSFTEKFCQALFESIARKYGLYAISGVICPELGLDRNSSADLAFCTQCQTVQKAENIKLLFEIKMSIVNNYQCLVDNEILFIGNYNTHRGIPSILRSYSVLKAIGKSLNIRASSEAANRIPIIVSGNTPITNHYVDKVEKLRKFGVIQHFINIGYSNHFSFIDDINQSYLAINDIELLDNIICKLLSSDMYYFSAMLPKQKLGEIIKKSIRANVSDLEAAEIFLKELGDYK